MSCRPESDPPRSPSRAETATVVVADDDPPVPTTRIGGFRCSGETAGAMVRKPTLLAGLFLDFAEFAALSSMIRTLLPTWDDVTASGRRLGLRCGAGTSAVPTALPGPTSVAVAVAVAAEVSVAVADWRSHAGSTTAFAIATGSAEIGRAHV